MRQLFRHRLLAALFAISMAAGAHAQQRNKDGTMDLPVWNQASGKVEAVLLLEPTDQAAGVRQVKLRPRPCHWFASPGTSMTRPMMLPLKEP